MCSATQRASNRGDSSCRQNATGSCYAVQPGARGFSVRCHVSLWFCEHYHKEETARSSFTEHGVLRVHRANVRIDGETIEVFQSPSEIALLIRGWSTDDPRLWCLGRIIGEGGPTGDEYFELCNPLTPDARIDEILTEVDQRAATWCAEHSDELADPRQGR